jgi:hypothetical protein
LMNPETGEVILPWTSNQVFYSIVMLPPEVLLTTR